MDINIISNLNNKEIFLFGYLIIINILAFILFGIDKMKAEKNQWRVSESTFIILGFLGASMRILIGMVIFKHKLSKKKFYIGIPLMLILNKFLELAILNYIK